jgi:subtilisin family serine protease
VGGLRRVALPFSDVLRGLFALGGLAAALAVLVISAAPAPVGAAVFHVASEQLVVQLSPQAELRPSSLLAGLPGQVPQLLPGRRWAVSLPTLEASALAATLSGKKGVDYVSPVAPVQAAGGVVPNNPCYDHSCGPTQPVVVEDPALGPGMTIVHPNGQTDLWAVGAPAAWAVTRGSANVLVAVLDTGVNPHQPQLAGKVVVGPDVCRRDRPLCESPYDQNGHGTFVTGIIAAATNDGIGIASLGWDTRVLDIKVLDDSGNGNTMDEATGIYDAVNAGAKVINLSSTNKPCTLSPSACGPNPDQQAAVEYALAHGVVVVAAAGNYGSSSPVYPADYPGVLSVAASTDQGVVNPVNGGPYLDFSDFGGDADIAAPGINVLSTWLGSNYAVESGTSYAAPHVSAAAALVMAADPSITGPQVAELLEETATPLEPGGAAIDGGFLNAGAAVEAAARHQVPTLYDGYQLVSADGSVHSAGILPPEGSLPARRATTPIVAAVEVPGGLGYWLAAAGGGVYAVGPGAHYYGSLGGRRLPAPITAMAATPDGRGYWLASAAGQVYAFGEAKSLGSVPPAPASGAAPTPASSAAPAPAGHQVPITAMAATPDGRGYWLASAAGQVYAFGDARAYGSPVNIHLAAPVVGVVSTPDGRGYWLVARDGGVFAYGDATYYGSLAKARPAQAIVGMALAPAGRGYWLAGAKGKVWAFGSASALAVSNAGDLGAPVVAITS